MLFFFCVTRFKKSKKGLTYRQFSAFPWFSKFGGQRWSWISSEYKHHRDDWEETFTSCPGDGGDLPTDYAGSFVHFVQSVWSCSDNAQRAGESILYIIGVYV